MMLMKADVFWDVTPRNLVEVYQLCRARSSDYQYTAARLCGVVFQKTVFLVVNAMRTSMSRPWWRLSELRVTGWNSVCLCAFLH